MSNVFGKIGSAFSRAVTLPSGMNSLSDMLGTGGPTQAAAPPGAPPQPTITPPPAPSLPTPPPDITSPSAPSAPAPIPAPDNTSPALMAAAKRAQQQSKQGGRAATILTTRTGSGNRSGSSRPSGTLDYSRSTLGAG